MMASSQVEIATSSSPFGCAPVHPRRDSCFQNNENSITNLWVHQPQWQGGSSSSVNGSSERMERMEGQKHQDKWARAREMVFPADDGSQSGGGVSSLVQKWRGLEAEAKSSGKSNSTAMATATAVDSSGAEDDSSLGGWESDRTAMSSSRGRDSDFTERERLRVADIIRKLTDPNEVGWDSPPRVRTEQSEQQRCVSPVVGSPRIRGRHAYIELLTQMERDRRKELQRLGGRKAVSQFSHRGRIQALLRIKFLRRGLEAKEGRFSSESPKANQSQLFRERANPIDSRSSDQELTDKAPAALDLYAGNVFGEEDKYQDVTNLESGLRAEKDRIQDSEDPITTSQGHHIHHASLQSNNDIRQNVDALHSYEENPFSKYIRQEDSWESSNHIASKSAETTPTFHNTEINYSAETPEINEHKKEDESTDHQVTAINYDLIGDSANPQSYHEEEEEGSTSNEHIVDTDAYWVSDVSHPEVGWEELHSDYQQNEESKRDWIGEVSRPRSDWEDLRQARYQEMLDPFLENEEIRVLLGRKSVSTFLSSGMRERIDQLMICRVEGQQSQKLKQIHEEKHEELPEQVEAIVSEEDEGEREGEGEGEDERDEGEVYGDYYDGFEEGESSVGQRYNESDEYMDQMTSSPAESWPQKSSDFLYQIPSPSTQLSSQDNGPNSCYRAHPAIEMELIYDLRRHMEQLHQEMSELRKSIKCCTDMQIELKHSIKKEVATALTHPDTKNGRRNPLKKGTSGGRCSVCRKVQVDCVLYRCGHMCTCFKCAHELQWSSGKCPVCRAPIMDVVRIYSN